MPKMTHPDAKGSKEVDPDQVEMFESQGWEKQTASKSDK
jgi:hypothetical protein